MMWSAFSVFFFLLRLRLTIVVECIHVEKNSTEGRSQSSSSLNNDGNLELRCIVEQSVPSTFILRNYQKKNPNRKSTRVILSTFEDSKLPTRKILSNSSFESRTRPKRSISKRRKGRVKQKMLTEFGHHKNDRTFQNGEQTKVHTLAEGS